MENENVNYFPEFNEDCYAECEEHFTIIRRGLLKLEKYIDLEKVEKPLLDELFRSFHTLKGLTGMIGQRDAEKLSHVMENFLRLLTKNTIKLSEPILNGFFEGIKNLEILIDSLRSNKEVPNLKPLINRLSKLETSSSKESEPFPIKSMVQQKPTITDTKSENKLKVPSDGNLNTKAFKIVFSPSPELFENGININTIKKQLEEIGSIEHSSPIVPVAGKIAFEFKLNSSLNLEKIVSILGSSVEVLPFGITKKSELENSVTDSNQPVSNSDRTFTLSNMVRVDLNRLDDLMKMIGDLVISRARLDDLLKGMENELPVQKYRQIQETALNFERQLRSMREGVMRVRLIQIGEIFERMQFVIRDMIKESHKKISLKISGKDTEIDKIVVEKMLDPLLHLVRNSVSHGIEMPDERIKNGKSAEGNILLNAFTSGDSVVIELQDDGIGINKKAVIRKAIELGLIVPQDDISDAEILEIICSQGFSTREEADMNSGRGVGMAVVKKTIQELGGILDLDTESGMGTKFSIHLPLTLAILDALILTAGGQKFAMPQPMVAEVLMIEKNSITKIENNELISYRKGVLPIIRLTDYFKLNDTSNGKSQVLVIGSGLKAVGIMVDKVLSLREIVVRSLTDPYVQVEGISGATELGDGNALLILDTSSLIKAVTIRKNNKSRISANKN